jgi:cell division protein FtsW
MKLVSALNSWRANLAAAMSRIRLPVWLQARTSPSARVSGASGARVGSYSGGQGSASKNYDLALVWVVAGLMAFGWVMVYSASIALPDAARFSLYKPYHFMMRHGFAMSLGVMVGMLAFCVPLDRWQKFAFPLFIVGLVMLMIVLIPGLGKVVYGARRWISFGFINLQPSELMKLFVVLYAADYTLRKQEYMQEFQKGFLPMGVAVAVVGLLLMLEPDLGALIVITFIAMGVLFVGGVNAKLATALVMLMSGIFALLITLSPWRRERMFAYLAPFDEGNALGKGYQLSHSLIAFGRGEWFGVGLGGSVEKLHYLPEAHTDFLLAVIGEEMGMVAVLGIVLAFFWLVYRGFEIGRTAIVLDRTFSGLVAKGISMWIGFQAFFNMGVNTGLLPTKGLTLPLMSYGGSGILVNCIAIGILLRVDFENRRMMKPSSSGRAGGLF